jgi:hypothetical protein
VGGAPGLVGSGTINSSPIAGWGIAVIIASGRVFDFISYYTPLIIIEQYGISTKPTLDLAKKKLKDGDSIHLEHAQKDILRACNWR